MPLTIQNTYKPFKYPWAMELARLHEEVHWTEDELKLGDDIRCWNEQMTDAERHFYRNNLLLFTQSDVQVASNYITALIPSVRNNEMRAMLLSFAAREGVHQRAYALMNETLGLDDSFYSEFLQHECMTRKVSFMAADDISTLEGRAKAFARTTFVEGGFLFSAFTMLMNAQRVGKMPGFGTAIDWSTRDESIHVEGNSNTFRVFLEKFPHLNSLRMAEFIDQMSIDVVELEYGYIKMVFAEAPGSMVDGLSQDQMVDLIRFLVDKRRAQLGYEPMFGVERLPVPWMSTVFNGASMVNFFERRVTDYGASGMTGKFTFPGVV